MISIIVPTKNDREIEDTLNSLNKTKKQEKTEIIVVDASKKETLLDIKKKFPKVRWLYYKNKSRKKRTFVEQLNLGTAKAKGDILVFVDSGCIVKKNWLTELINPIKKEKENFVVGFVKPMNKKSIHDSHYDKQTKYVEFCGTAGSALKKSVALDIGKRDKNFNYGSDVDFSWRAINKGYKIRYVPKAIIYHDWGNLNSDIKRAIKYAEARINLYKKHPDKLSHLLVYNKDFFSVYSIFFFLYIISLVPVSIFYPWYLLLIIIPFFKNIKHKLIRKMIFDFFWGYGFLKRLLEVIFFNKNETNKK